MKAPWFVQAAIYSQALPIVVAARPRFGRSPVRRWVVLWCALMLFCDFAMQLVRHISGPNLWVWYILGPIASGVGLWMLSLWQEHQLPRLTMRLTIPLIGVVLATLALTMPVDAAFQRFGDPFQALILLSGSLYTLVSRSLAEPEHVTQRDWFWVTLGMSLYFALNVALPPFAHALVDEHPKLVWLAYNTKAWNDIIVFVLIARGMLCPVPRVSSG